MAKRQRPKGSRNKGYFFRTGRCWCATDKTPLTDEQGNLLRDKDIDARIVKEAYARYLLSRNQPVTKNHDITVMKACQSYLDHCRSTDRPSTYRMRRDTLFDFCTGLPARYWNSPPSKKERDEVRIHKGYGNLLVSELLPLHIDNWLDAHPTWKGSRRTHIQAVKRALNYMLEATKSETESPLKGYKAGKPRARITYLTPEQEQACYKFAKPALATAIKVCIRTGARYGCEFARLTRKHVRITVSDQGSERMTWTFSPDESKTGGQTNKERIIRITDPGIIDVVKRQMERYPTGPLFRNSRGTPWTQPALGEAFRRLKRRLARKGIELDDDACMYTTRHTYAKRTLQGFWSKELTNIETLAELMGDTPQTCRDHYARWCDSYTEPLWLSA